MSWNYRIVHHKGSAAADEYIALHEVFYHDDGSLSDRTEKPITFVSSLNGEGLEWAVKDLISSLEMALQDARKHPVLTDDDCPWSTS